MIGLRDTRSTIVAIATSASPSLRGAVRIVGDDAVDILQKMVSSPLSLLKRASVVPLRITLASPLGAVDAQALIWPTSRSYTGCPSVEIHTHGALPILEAIIALAVHHGARPAGPGEFTMRAFLAGRLDLTQAEAVLGVIDATSREQLDSALMQLAGNVSAPLRETREQLLNLLADLEAGLDFVEEDISFIDDKTLYDGLASALNLIESTAKKLQSHRRSEAFDWVVLRGRPNAGKSSLLNALLGEAFAIVSGQSGTTRDAVWKELSVQGYPIRLADTAGIESGEDLVTLESQQAAADIQSKASLTIHCCDATTLFEEGRIDARGEERVLESEARAAVYGLSPDHLLCVATKGDLLNAAESEVLRQRGWIVVSVSESHSLEILRDRIVQNLSRLSQSNETGVPATAARCADATDRAVQSLTCALNLLDLGAGHELIAAEMRQTLAAIGEITGEIYTDDILDRVFSRFCIGK